MRFQFRPRSMIRLLFMAFVVVALPLLLAVLQAMHAVDTLADQSRQAVMGSVDAAEQGGLLIDLLSDLERRARQYIVLRDEELLGVFDSDHQRLQAVIQDLSSRLPEPSVQVPLQRLDELLKGMAQMLSQLNETKLTPEGIRNHFDPMKLLANQAVRSSDHLIQNRVSAIRRDATRIQSELFWRSTTLIPLTLAMIALFTAMISKPIRQLKQAISGLGDERFDRPIRVVGPRDLETIGERLEWLRLRLLVLAEEKNRFLRHISHELKTPLASLREGALLLADEVPGRLNREQSEVVGILNTSSMRLQDLIERLLDYNLLQQETGLRLETLDLGDLCADVVADHRLAAAAKSQWFCLPERGVTISADRAKLQRTIDNLISNAVSFSPANGPIEIRLEAHGDQVILEVQDQGPGISRKQREQVFEPFFQGDAPRQGHLKGSGIGLSVAKECILAHRGSIRVMDSKVGACIQIRLPLNQEEVGEV